jgi:hypothetical protein
MSNALDHQHAWLADLQYLDPYWARQEFDLRKQAVVVQQQLATQGQWQDVRLALHVPQPPGFLSPTASFPAVPTTTFNEISFPVLRVGGDEELLLVEECLRRAYAGMGW